ncbi:hypothetical protein WOLCODRAFT_156317 [Wolfiporia cocos MD-104 SS10]|uniref:Uncharacterized protein n=1 Tax=Wolfiporia cocos (strain MD-104) TaxID=742152 RepID=A0A2H3JFY6_WOLCO|nr:hypothetical protein WOLCODRAFT_156317 [Wolfiporia cocos MD-104 SS10]
MSALTQLAALRGARLSYRPLLRNTLRTARHSVRWKTGPATLHEDRAPHSASGHASDVQPQRESPVSVPIDSASSKTRPAAQNGPGQQKSGFPSSGSSFVDAVITTLTTAHPHVVFFGGVAYVTWYKKNVLDKIELAFAKGYDPVLEIAGQPKRRSDAKADGGGTPDFTNVPWTQHLRRREQDLVDQIIGGTEFGQYFLLLGPKGTGKGTMILDAMHAVQAEGVAMCDAHPDLEVFRLRLGRALNYEYNEDTQTGLFQRRDPREAGPALDIERALNKLEKVALRYTRRTGRPLVLVLNNIHFFQNDDGGRNMLLQLQQRAESWAAGGILTMVFTSDDFWPFHVMRKGASRMNTMSISDLTLLDSVRALSYMRARTQCPPAPPSALRDAAQTAGGRLAHLTKLARAPDVRRHADELLQRERAWLLSEVGLIPDCDDDVMDEQKWSAGAWLLLREFVRLWREAEAQRSSGAGEEEGEYGEVPLPRLSYYRCRQIMTRADFLEELDRRNIIAIDINHDVTPDSLLILRAAEQVVAEEGFEDLLNNVLTRIDAIESLHRTRELTFKDLAAGDSVRLAVDKGGARVADD